MYLTAGYFLIFLCAFGVHKSLRLYKRINLFNPSGSLCNTDPSPKLRSIRLLETACRCAQKPLRLTFVCSSSAHSQVVT